MDESTTHGGWKALRVTRTAADQGLAQDVKAVLEANGPGDYFLEARVRLGSIAGGSQAAAVAIVITDEKGNRKLTSKASPVSTNTWTDLRAVRGIAWDGVLVGAELSVTTRDGLDPLLVDDVILQKYPYPEPAGRADAPSYLTAVPESETEIVATWTDNANDWTPEGNTRNEAGFQVDWATDAGFTRNAGSREIAADTTECTVDGLEAGTTYCLRVRALGAAGGTEYANVAVATTKGAAAGPATPTDVAVTRVAGSEVELTWTDNARNETGYRIEWSSDPDFVTNPGSADVAADGTSYTVTGLHPSSTYAFRVRALGGKAGGSASSEVVQKVTWRGTPNGTAAHLAAEVAGSDEVRLTWADDCTNETGYVVEHATDAGFTENVGALSTKENASSCKLTGLKAGNEYHLRVRPVNALGSGDNIANPKVVEGGYSETVVLLLSPSAPGELAAWVHSSTRVNLNWTDHADNETGFRIDRAIDAGFTRALTSADVAADVTRYSATGLDPETTYCFRVRTVNAGGESANTEAVSVTTPGAGTPATPSGLEAAAESSSEIGLTWTDNADDEAGFEVDRAADGGFTKDLVTVEAAADATSPSATGLRPATTYYFRTRAVNAAGCSVNSRIASATTLPLPPAVPGPLTVSRVTETEVTVAWTDNSDNESGFKIDRAADRRFARDLVSGTVGADVISCTASDLEAETTYHFRVRGYNVGGESGSCESVEVTTASLTAPAAPSDLAGTAVSGGQASLFWIDNSSNETGFVIESATDEGFAGGLVTARVPADTCRYDVTGLATSTTCYFRVRAVNAVGESASSNRASATTRADDLAAGDAFEGPAGARLDGLDNLDNRDNRDGGAGWSGAWNARDSYTLGDGSLTYVDGAGAALVTTGNRLVLGPKGGHYREAKRDIDIFAERMRGGTPLDVWFSCLVNSREAVRDFKPWGNSAYYGGPQAQGGTKMKYVGGNAWKGGKEVGKRALEVILKPDRVNIIICRYEVAADLSSFMWTWYVNPADLGDPLRTSTETVWTATNAAGALRGLDGFSIRTRPGGKGGFEIDEIRYGDTVAVVTPHIPAAAAPTGLTAAAASANRIDLAWTDNAESETGFRIDRATDSDFTRNLATTTVAPSSRPRGSRTRYSVTVLAAGTTYHFRVRAVNAAGESADCDTAAATTIPPGEASPRE